MESLDPIELFKNSPESNAEEWLKTTSIVSWGVVTKVIAKSIVQVQQVVREGISKKMFIVPILSVGSRLLEESAEASVGDLVLLLFLDKYSRAMFDNALARYADTKDYGFEDRDAVGYNKSSGIGILMSPHKGVAETIIRHYMDGINPAVLLRSRAKFSATFRREMTVLFDALPGAGALVDRLVSITFGQNSPFTIEHWAAVTRKYGFAVNADKSLQTVVAPITETYSTMAPISKDIRGMQTIVIGKGTSPAGDPSGSLLNTHAPVSIDLGTDADITITTKSNISIVSNGITYKIAADGTFSIVGGSGTLFSIDASGNVKAAGNITAGTATPATQVDLLNHMHPTAPMGPPSAPVPGS